MKVTEECKELFEAISAAQGEFTTVEKNAANPHFKSKFAPLDSIIEMIRPILPKHGLSVTQHCDIPESGAGIIVETVIAHKSGQYISSRLFMPVAKQDPQGYGSSLTYGKRYALSAVLGIVSDEDVDGNQGDGKGAGKQQQGNKPAQQQKQQGKPAVEVSEAQKKLYDALAETYHGNLEEMADALRTYSSFTPKATEANPTPETRWLKLADLEHGNDNDKFQRWVGAALGKLRDDQQPPQ
jgi:hypothetical protein